MRTIAQLMDMHGRVALVTGACGHVGSTVVSAFAELGASIAILDLDGGACDLLATRARATWGVDAVPLAADLRNSQTVAGIPAHLAATLGRLDVLVHCAALVGTYPLEGWVTSVEDQSIDTWREALEVNLTSSFALTQAVLPLLRSSGHGSIINVASIYGLVGPDWSLYQGTDLGSPAAYAASKGGLLQLTRWLATTLAPDIRVNAISPGGILRNTPEPFRSRYESRTPLGRMGVEEDLIGAAVFLATDLSSYVTGHNLVVDGGWTSW